MYNYIVNVTKSIVEKGLHGTVADFAVMAGFALIAFCLAMVLWKMLRYALFCLNRTRQLSEWRKGKMPGPKPRPQGQAAH